MDDKNTKYWSKLEFQTYLFIYCINADFKETNEELKILLLKSDNATFKKMHTEFENDNDYEAIQKINDSFIKLEYKKDEIDDLFKEIKELFLTDGKYEQQERNIMIGLKKILN